MRGKTRLSIASLGVVAAIGILFAVLPAFGSSHDNAIRLHMAADGQSFSYVDAIPDSSPQPIETTPNGRRSCEVKTTSSNYGKLVTLSGANGTALPVGNVDFSLGVKSSGSNSNGTPCSQVSVGESLTFGVGTFLDSRSQLFEAVRFDLEMTSDAVVELTFDTTATRFRLETGTSINPSTPVIDGSPNTVDSQPGPSDPSGYPLAGRDAAGDGSVLAWACIVANSSGPNNQSNDNCAWTVNPGVEFSSVTVRVVGPPNGTVSVEGSNDWGGNSDYDTLFYLANAAPVAVDDSYETNERGAASPALTFTEPAPGVLGNDTDIDSAGLLVSEVNGDSTNVGVLVPIDDAQGNTVGTLTLATDGSFSYSPNLAYEWGDDEFVRADTWEYTVSDGEGGSDTAMVTMTVYRVICSGEEVRATDVFVSGVFQPLTDPELCKRYVLTASDADKEVIFEPEGTSIVYYRGFLTFADDPGASPGANGGAFSIGLEYDPDGPDGGDPYRALLACLNPQFDASGGVEAPGLDSTTEIPADETWCIASFRGVATTAGAYAIEWQVVGEGDPGFRAG